MKPIIRWTLALALWLACTAAVAVAHCLLMVVILVMALWATAAFGQTAVITGPSEGAAGYPIRLFATGPEGATFEWSVVPIGAARSLSPDLGGRSLVFANPHNDTYVLTLVVGRGTPTQSDATHNLTLTDGEPGPPGPPLPPPVDLSAYVKRLTEEVSAKADEFDDVSGIFFDLAGRISKGDLNGSKDIVPATAEALFGPKGNSRANWKAWHTAIMSHLRNDLNLVLQSQWESAFKTIGEAVKR